MPSVSKKQHNLMAAVAHNPKFAKKVGIPQSVGEEFNKADKGKQFKRGGEMATNTLKALRANHRNDVKSVNKQNSEERKTLRSSMKEKNATGKDTRKAMQDLRGSQSTRMKEMNAANKLSRVKAAATQRNERDMAAAQKKDSAMADRKPGVYAGLTGKPAPAAKPAAKADSGLKKSLSFARDIAQGKPAPAAKPAGNVVQRMQSAMQKKESAMADRQKKESAMAARKPAAPAPQTPSAAPAAKPAAPAGETISPMDPGRTPMGAGAKAFAPAIKKAKGGKVCGMKAGGVKKELPTAKDLGSMNMKKGGRVKCMAGGGYVRAADGVTKKGKTKGKII